MFTNTVLVDVTYVAGACSVMLGVIVTLWPPGTRWWKFVCVSAFVAFAVAGGVCVHLTQVAADREQEDNRAEARKEQSTLREQVSALQKQLKTAGDQLEKVSKQTAPLARGPLRVEISNPQAVARQIQEPKWRQSGPLRWLPKEVNPSYVDALSAVEVTIQADRELPNATIEVVCDAPMLGDPRIEAVGAFSMNLGGPTVRDGTVRFTVISPMLSEGQAYRVTLESGQRSPAISVTSVRKVQ